MQVLSLVWGVLVLIGTLIGRIPHFTGVNWVLIPLGGLGMLLGAIALVTSRPGGRKAAVGGIVTNGVAVGLGLLRLFSGTPIL